MLPCLVVVVNLRGVLEVAGDWRRTRDVARAQVAVIICPPLHVGLAVKDVGDTGRGDKE